MPYEEHPVANEPPEGTTLWRYMDYPSLVWLFQKHKLHFHRADSFDDPFEGSLPEPIKEARDGYLRNSDAYGEHQDVSVEMHEEAIKSAKSWMYLNCWHANRRESAAMWEIYGDSNKSVAIKSSVEALKESLQVEEDHPVHLTSVEYLDWEDPDFEKVDQVFSGIGPNAITPYLVKRKSYEHENEVRAFILNMPLIEEDDLEDIEPNFEIDGEELKIPMRASNRGVRGFMDTISEPDAIGYDVEIDLESLIDRIYVSHRAPEWFYETVRELVDLLGPSNIGEEDVYYSTLSNEPVY